MKKLLLITMLLGFGYAGECEEYNEQNNTTYNCDCNESNWQENYNSEGHNMGFCNLEGANLLEANLSGAHLAWANLAGADLSYANLQGAIFANADLSYANLNYVGAYGANFANADLLGAYLDGYLPLANFYHANLTDANLTDADCWGALFVQATLDNTIFDGANLEFAYFDENEDMYDDVSYDAGIYAGAGEDYVDGYIDGFESGYDEGANSADPCYGVVCDDDPEMICICGECTYEDEQGDTGGAEDCSYGDECFDAGAESGDLNLDGTDNVLDVVILVDNIINP